MLLFNSLYTKLAAAFLILLAILGVGLWWISHVVSQQYSQEVMQRLNESVAMYIANKAPLIDGGIVNESAIDQIANSAMILNPSLELYILDSQGHILSHRLPVTTVKLSQVDTRQFDDFLNSQGTWPKLVKNPRKPTQNNVFSVAPIMQAGQLQGYVFAIVGGKTYQQLRTTVMDSYILRNGIVLMLVSVVLAALLGCLVFFLLTRRLSRLTKSVNQFDVALPVERQLLSCGQSHQDEINTLHTAFNEMAQKIHEQFSQQQLLDTKRRELIANTSHDLRTPLTAMQGYIETLMLHNHSLGANQRYQYLNVAFSHCQRLKKLIDNLFELSKFESKNVAIKQESFPIAELLHDCVQEFQLLANKKQIKLNMHIRPDYCFVYADLELIHRVIQNLLDNAIEHTPINGSVTIVVTSDSGKVSIEISDSGEGIHTQEIPHIFDRYYQAQFESQQKIGDKKGSGLGLAIVKHILDLHNSCIDVKSQINKGTSFIFMLEQYTPSSSVKKI